MTLNVLKPVRARGPQPPAARDATRALTATRLRDYAFGALVRMAAAEDHPVVRTRYPFDPRHSGARRLASDSQYGNSSAGNILQRTRCEYYRETSWPCNKRAPGSGCSGPRGHQSTTRSSLARVSSCIAAYAGDFAQASIALDATVHTDRRPPGGSRQHRFRRSASLRPARHHTSRRTLAPGELITFINVPAGPWTTRSHYVKVRDRQSYQFALTCRRRGTSPRGEPQCARRASP